MALKQITASIPGVAGGAREGDRVAHVGEAGDIGEGALEAEAEAGVGHRAVAALGEAQYAAPFGRVASDLDEIEADGDDRVRADIGAPPLSAATAEDSAIRNSSRCMAIRFRRRCG